MRNPWRLALGYVYALTGRRPALTGIGQEEQRIVVQQIDRRLNTPLTSAAGRLFDAVAALAGVQQQVSYEAQAAIELEMLATRWAEGGHGGRAEGGHGGHAPTFMVDPSPPPYPFDVEMGDGVRVIRLRRLIDAIQADLAAGNDAAEVGWRFHQTMAGLIATVCRQIAGATGLDTVALSGGCFQNRLLLALTVPRLEQAGLRVLLHRQVPCNDGGLSLGQAVLAHFAQQGAQP